jgi:threonine synthase
VPTGNFGNVFAGWAARRMGLPVERLVVATNVNDILDRALSSGRYEVRGVVPTTSPSMDIEVSSNFERAVFEAEGRDSAAVRRAMAGLAQAGAFTLSPRARERLAADFASGACDEAAGAAAIAATLRDSAVLVDPHSAVGAVVATRHLGEAPMVALATAHPAKFPEAVEAACGRRPELPEWARGMLKAKENYRIMPAELGAVEAAVEERTRAAGLVG